MNTDTRIERPNAARLARFDATRLDRPELGYPARHRLNEDLETRRLMVVPQLAVGQVPVPLPTRAPGAAMRQVQDVPARRPVGVLAKLRNSLGRFRP